MVFKEVKKLKAYSSVSKIIHKISFVFAVISAVAMMFMAIISTVDVVGRYIFNHPLTGAQEIVEVTMCVFVYAGLALAISQDKVIFVPVIVERLSVKVQGVIKCVGNILCAVMSFLILYQLTIPTVSKMSNFNQATMVLKIPHGPLYVFVVICYGLISLELILKGIENVLDGYKPMQEQKVGDEE